MELGKKITQDGAAIQAISGRIRMTDTQQLEAALHDLLAGGEGRYVLDLSGVTYICSSALGALIALKRQVLKSDGEIRLIVAPGDVMELLRLTMVDKVFQIHGAVKEAIAAFGP